MQNSPPHPQPQTERLSPNSWKRLSPGQLRTAQFAAAIVTLVATAFLNGSDSMLGTQGKANSTPDKITECMFGYLAHGDSLQFYLVNVSPYVPPGSLSILVSMSNGGSTRVEASAKPGNSVDVDAGLLGEQSLIAYVSAGILHPDGTTTDTTCGAALAISVIPHDPARPLGG